jgi:hypothetical protein
LPTYPQAGGEGEGGEEEENGGARSSTTRREAGAAREEDPDPREPSTPATPCFLGFPFTASSICFPYQRRLLPRHRAAHLFTDACASASGHPGEDAVSSPLWTPRPSSRGGTPAAPPLVMPAIEPGWVAIFCRCRRLRRRARHPPSLSPLAVGRRPVLSPPHRVGAPASRPRRVRVRARARAGRGARTQACTPARVRRSLEGMAGPLAPFSCLRRRSPPCLGRPRRRDPAVVFWDARTVAKRKKRRVLGRRFLTRVLAPECGRLVHRRPWRRTGLHSALRRAAPLWPAPNLSPCRTPCVRAHPGARPCARVHAPPPREGTRTPTERRHRAGVVAPTPAPTSP